MKKSHLFSGCLTLAAAIALGSLVFSTGAGAQTTTSSSSNTSTNSSSGILACTAPTYIIGVGQSLQLTATGGNGSYTWSSPGLVTTNPTGSSFTVSFNRTGTYPVTVASNGATATCTISVTSASTGSTGGTTTPGLPNTGELPE